MTRWKFLWRLLQGLVVFWLMTKVVGLVFSLMILSVAVIFAALFAAVATIQHFLKKKKGS